MEDLKHFVTIVLSTPKRITSDFIFKSFSCQKKKKNLSIFQEICVFEGGGYKLNR